MTVVPGALSKILTYSLAPLPRPVRARVMGRIMRGMTKHLDETVFADTTIENESRETTEIRPDVADRLREIRSKSA